MLSRRNVWSPIFVREKIQKNRKIKRPNCWPKAEKRCAKRKPLKKTFEKVIFARRSSLFIKTMWPSGRRPPNPCKVSWIVVQPCAPRTGGKQRARPLRVRDRRRWNKAAGSKAGTGPGGCLAFRHRNRHRDVAVWAAHPKWPNRRPTLPILGKVGEKRRSTTWKRKRIWVFLRAKKRPRSF